MFFVLLPLCDMSVGWSPESTWFLQALLPSGCEIHRRAHRTACLLRFLVFITRNTEELLSQITWFTYTAETIGIDIIISNHMFSPHPNWKHRFSMIWCPIALKQFLPFDLVIPGWKIRSMEILLERKKGICSKCSSPYSLWGPETGAHPEYLSGREWLSQGLIVL